MGQAVKRLRKQKKFTQQKLGQSIWPHLTEGTCRKYICMIERGTYFDKDIVSEVCNFLGLSFSPQELDSSESTAGNKNNPFPYYLVSEPADCLLIRNNFSLREKVENAIGHKVAEECDKFREWLANS